MLHISQCKQEPKTPRIRGTNGCYPLLFVCRPESWFHSLQAAPHKGSGSPAPRQPPCYNPGAEFCPINMNLFITVSSIICILHVKDVIIHGELQLLLS